MHGKTFDSSERSCSNNQDSDSNKITLSKLEVVNQKYCSTDANSSISEVSGYGSDNKITACKSDICPSSLSFNLTKLSSALSSFYPSFANPDHRVDESSKTIINSDDQKINSIANLEMAKVISEVNLTSSSALKIDAKGIELDLINKMSNLKTKLTSTPSTNASVISSATETNTPDASPKSDTRGGKYNKKHAPLPPLPSKRDNHADNPIKATLVLKPGVVRSLSSSAESLNKEIFLSYSPKVRRKSRNQSPASRSSRSNDSNSSNKVENALSKVLRLPKKVANLNIPSKVKDKRNSWGEFFNTKKFEDKKVQSKSATNLNTIKETEKSQDMDKPIQRSGSQISIKSLADSPMTHRRLKIIRRYVDNDID